MEIQKSGFNEVHVDVTSSRLDRFDTFFSIFAAVFSAPFTFFSFLPFLPMSAEVCFQTRVNNPQSCALFH